MDEDIPYLYFKCGYTGDLHKRSGGITNVDLSVNLQI